MIEVREDDIPRIASWLSLHPGWEFPRVTSGLFAQHPARPYPLEITSPAPGQFTTEDRNRFLLDSFRRRHMTAWLHHFRLLLTAPEVSRPGFEVWTVFPEEGCEVIPYGEGLSFEGESPEAAMMRAALHPDPELPNWERWIDKPKRETMEAHYENLGKRSEWPDDSVGLACLHSLQQFKPGEPLFYCPICRFYFTEDYS